MRVRTISGSYLVKVGTLLLVGINGGCEILVVLGDLLGNTGLGLSGCDLVGRLSSGLDIGLLDSEASSEWTSNSVVTASDSANVSSGTWQLVSIS